MREFRLIYGGGSKSLFLSLVTFTQVLCSNVCGQNILTFSSFKSTYETKIVWNDKIVVVDTVLFHFHNKPWNTQPRVQKLLEYHYQFDTVRLREVLLNEGTFDFILKSRWKRKYRRKKSFSFLRESEGTGYILNSNYFYFHPIRSGLYDKTHWAPHPFVEFKAFDTNIDTFYNNIRFPQLGVVEMKYISKKELIIDGCSTDGRQVLKIIANSKISDEKHEKIKHKNWFNEDKNNVQLNMIFSIERGFESIEYLFPSGTRIEYNLISIEFE